MKQTKKPTYKELEETKIFYLRVLVLFFLLLTILAILEIFSIVDLVNKDRQLNQTEGKNYSCDFVGAIKPEDTRICEDEVKEENKIKYKACNYTQINCSWTFELAINGYKDCAYERHIEKCNKTNSDYCLIDGFVIRKENFTKNVTTCEVIE